MKQFTKEFLDNHITYIDAIKQAIEEYEKASDYHIKDMYSIIIGEIGNEMYKQNIAFENL